jgi:hypothetical protein
MGLVTEQELKIELLKGNNGKSSDIDEIHSKFLIYCGNQVKGGILKLFNDIWVKETILQDWNTETIAYIQKIGLKGKYEN